MRFIAPERSLLAGDLAPSTPLNGEAFLFSYPANEKVSDFLSDYLHKIAEAEIISHELVCHHLALCLAPIYLRISFQSTNPKETLHSKTSLIPAVSVIASHSCRVLEYPGCPPALIQADCHCGQDWAWANCLWAKLASNRLSEQLTSHGLPQCFAPIYHDHLPGLDVDWPGHLQIHTAGL